MPYYTRSHQLSGSLVYHVLNRSNSRIKIFHDSTDYEYFKCLILKYSAGKDVKIYHYCIIFNHYHLLLEIATPEELSGIMANINRLYAVYHHKKYKTNGYLWQGRFKSLPIQKNLYMLGCGRYIERNPVASKIAAKAEEYLYSSARYYVLGSPDDLVCEDPLYEEFGRSINERREEYRKFLLDFDSEDEKLYTNFETPMGDSSFKAKLIRQSGHYMPRRRGMAQRR